jgi:hypothetical protein
MLYVYWVALREPMPGWAKVGVTAQSEADAHELILAQIGPCEIETIEPIADMNTLDAGHVLPNIGNHLRRGIWYPLGFAPLT